MTATMPGLHGRVLRKDIYFQETGYVPHLGQEAVHYDNHRFRVLVNGRRWGKTLLGGKEVEPTAFVTNRLGEAQRGWIVGPNYDDCEKEFRVVYDTFKKLGIDKVSSKFLNNTENGNMVIKTKWGFVLECRSAAHPETLVGEGLDFALLVEAGRHKRKTWAEYLRPALSDKRGWALFSGVPEGATDTSLLYWLWKRGQDTTKLPWASWRMPSWTNDVVFPGGRQDPEILDAEDDLTEDEFRRQYGAEFVDRIGRVMKEWDDEIHLRNLDYRRDWPLYLAIDYGYTNPFVLLWIQVDAFNNVYVIREDRWTLKDTVEIAKEVKENSATAHLLDKVVAMYPDPAEPDDTNILQREWRKPARANTGGEIKNRVAMIRKALKLQNEHLPDGHIDKIPGIFVDHSCVQLAWEMREGYRWPEHKSEVKNQTENPLDKDNHGPEALGRFFKGYMDVVGKERRARMGRAKVRRG
jgi:hypothetical protein